MPPYTRQRAYSLLELLATLSIVTLLMGLIAPSLTALLQKSRIADSVNQMHAYLNYAREKAISSRSYVSLCAGHNTCESTRLWRAQILIFQDHNRNGQLDQGEQLLKIANVDANHHWNWTNFRQKNHMTFKPDGITDSLNGTFTLCETNHAIRSIVINITGRAKVEIPADSDKCRT